MPLRKCVFGCQADCPIFKLPKDDTVVKKWLDFIFGSNPLPIRQVCCVCANHFTDDCFLNKREFDMGLISRLSLKNGAVPSLRVTQTPLLSSQAPPATASFVVKKAAPSCARRSVSTQLSAGTLRLHHFRSKGVQATVQTTSRGTGTEQSLPKFSSMPAKSVFGTRSKRPHLELGEKEDDDFCVSIPVSQDSTYEPGDTDPDLSESQDSTYEPGDTDTDLSDKIDMESPIGFEDANYIDCAVPTLIITQTHLLSSQVTPATASFVVTKAAPSCARRSVSTQLSAGTLRLHHFRSKGVQATVQTTSKGTGTEQSLPKFSSMPAKSVFGTRSKRPHLELGEKEDDDFCISIPVSQDSTYEPGDTDTDLSDMVDMESPSGFEDTKYIVDESALRELFEMCPVCNRHCIVDQRGCGTFVAFKQDCPHCSFTRKWQSEPMLDEHFLVPEQGPISSTTSFVDKRC